MKTKNIQENISSESIPTKFFAFIKHSTNIQAKHQREIRGEKRHRKKWNLKYMSEVMYSTYTL